jgi:hypothetical protein
LACLMSPRCRGRELLARPPLANCETELVIDQTGVGAAVADLFEIAGLNPRRVSHCGLRADPHGCAPALAKQILISISTRTSASCPLLPSCLRPVRCKMSWRTSAGKFRRLAATVTKRELGGMTIWFWRLRSRCGLWLAGRGRRLLCSAPFRLLGETNGNNQSGATPNGQPAAA